MLTISSRKRAPEQVLKVCASKNIVSWLSSPSNGMNIRVKIFVTQVTVKWNSLTLDSLKKVKVAIFQVFHRVFSSLVCKLRKAPMHVGFCEFIIVPHSSISNAIEFQEENSAHTCILPLSVQQKKKNRHSLLTENFTTTIIILLTNIITNILCVRIDLVLGLVTTKLTKQQTKLGIWDGTKIY